MVQDFVFWKNKNSRKRFKNIILVFLAQNYIHEDKL